jgi:hypothetical protein
MAACKQVFRSILAWCDEHNASGEFPAMFSAVRTHHLETFECRSLLVRLTPARHRQASTLACWPASLLRAPSSIKYC